MAKHIYLLTVDDDLEPLDCNVALGFVVRAETPEEARELASKDCGDEGPEVWFDSSKSTIEVVGTCDGGQRSEVLLRDFLG